jgi:subtilisin family serine protease
MREPLCIQPALRLPCRASWHFLPVLGMAFGLLLAACGGSSEDKGAEPKPLGDPLAQYQWHLQNTGQQTFSGVGGVPGIDLRATEVYLSGEAGDGVRVLVLDDGLDIKHPDLRDRVQADMLHNFDPAASNTDDPTPQNDDSHGTLVGGIIAATADNGIGGRGVAPRAGLGGARYLCAGCNSPVNLLDAYGGAAFSRNADVINGSFGSTPLAPIAFDPDTDLNGVVLQHLATLRSGRGIVFVKAAGNEYFDDPLTEGTDCSRAQAAKVTCSNTNAQPDQAMPQQIVVGAVNANGVKATYSNAGSSLLVAGLGGEFGLPFSDPRINLVAGPAILSTDLAGCDRGSVKTGTVSLNSFNNAASEISRLLNPDCDYSATMNGTSAATPTVAGVVALMLHANPMLTWRDVRAILMKTARRIDAARVPNTVVLPSGEPYVPEPAWTQNGAGLWFDNWYGFGLADAAAAVAMAKAYSSYLTGPMRTNGPVTTFAQGCAPPTPADGCGTDIPVGTASGLDIPLSVEGSVVSKIEAVQVTLELGAESMGDVAVEIISPAGTRSVLMTAYSTLTTTPADVSDFFLASYGFNDEPGNGTWTLRLIDVGERSDPEPGKFKAAQIQILGH